MPSSTSTTSAPTGAAPTGRSTTRSAWRSGRSTNGQAAAAGPQGAEGLLLPARPRADEADASLAPATASTRAATRNPARQRVRLGTSVGWSDIYPAEYDRQWVNVSGLRGCFAFVMRVDPQNLLYEEDEHDNRSVRIVRLPYHPGPQHC